MSILIFKIYLFLIKISKISKKKPENSYFIMCFEIKVTKFCIILNFVMKTLSFKY